MFVEIIYDLVIAIPVLAFAFTQGVFPSRRTSRSWRPSTSRSSPRTRRGRCSCDAARAARVRRLRGAVRPRARVLGPGPPGAGDPARPPPLPARGVRVQFAGWLFRFAAFWCLLDAFGVGGSVRNVLLVLGVNAVAAIVPFTPGGAGVQQALLVKVFGGSAARWWPPTRSASRSRSGRSHSRSASPRS